MSPPKTTTIYCYVKQLREKIRVAYLKSLLTFINRAWLISNLCHIYESVNWVSIDSGNGLTNVWPQITTWINADLLSIGTLRKNFNEIRVEIQNFPFMKNALENGVCENGGLFVRGMGWGMNIADIKTCIGNSWFYVGCNYSSMT